MATKQTIKGTKKQARKRHRQSEQRRDRNRAVRSRVRRQMRRMRAALAEGDAEQIQKLLPETMSVIDNGWRKGVIHKNTASRYKSRLSSQAQAAISASAS